MTIDELLNDAEQKKLKSIIRRLNKIGRELQELDLALFGWSGSGCIIKYDDNASGGAYAIENLTDLRISGGDPDYEAID